MKKINKKLLSILVCVIAIICLVFLFNRPSAIKFNDLSRKIEINSVVDFSRFIDTVKQGEVKDVVIDDSQVKLNQLGKYDVIYKIGDKKETLTIEIVDTVPPKVTLMNKTIAYNYSLKPEELIKEVQDATQTTASFKEKYSFDKAGKMEVTVVVEDQGKNVTEQKATVTVLEKDEEKPVIKTNEITLDLNAITDLKYLIEVTDNQDKNVKVTIDDSGLKRDKEGDYKVRVTAVDASMNKSEKDVVVHMKKRTADKQKIVYLTFDDVLQNILKMFLRSLISIKSKQLSLSLV